MSVSLFGLPVGRTLVTALRRPSPTFASGCMHFASNPESGGGGGWRSRVVNEKTPRGKLDDDWRFAQPEPDAGDAEPRHRDAEKQPLRKWPGGVHPVTGERGGPAGPEPTRFGDWERKGKTVDF